MRPRFFQAAPVAEDPLQVDVEAASPQQPSPSSSSSEMTKTERLFMKCEGAVQGVCELHKATGIPIK